MLKPNRRDRIADPADTANTVLKPAIYDPPGSANPGGGSSARSTPPPRKPSFRRASAATNPSRRSARSTR